jgi:hypothetical protein
VTRYSGFSASSATLEFSISLFFDYTFTGTTDILLTFLGEKLVSTEINNIIEENDLTGCQGFSNARAPMQQNNKSVSLSTCNITHLIRRNMNSNKRIDELFRFWIENQSIESFFVPCNGFYLLDIYSDFDKFSIGSRQNK